MSEKIIDTIIIGAGIAGIGCARKLAEQNKDFIVITEDIGGRIMASEDGLINYGAYFVLDNYYNLLPLVKKGEKLHPFSIDFHNKTGDHYHLARMFNHPVQAVRLLSLLYGFKSKYNDFKRRCERSSQKKVIEDDTQLKKWYTQSAADYIKEENITDVVTKFLSEGVYMCTFLPLSKVSAFDFLRISLGLLIPTHEFIFLPEQATEPFKENIIIDTVTKIDKTHVFKIETNSGKKYEAHNIVLATPPHISQKLIHLNKIKGSSNAYVFHIEGALKEEWEKGQFELFENSSSVVFIRKQKDNSYVLFSKVIKPNLQEYFIKPKVIFEKHWEPAFNITGNDLLECKQKNGLYLIGDYNIVGMEDAYITGLYVANEILKTVYENN
ncbi:MAG: NAD(P)-binding protein [bacterium]|nr:NAD(P)-binding protein [bacterium]